MKRTYFQPSMKELETDCDDLIMASTDTTNVYTDDPQNPGNALSRGYDVWDEED